jgi:hypothetical protein
MNVPWSLRFTLAWAILRSEVIAISVDWQRQLEAVYRFDFSSRTVQHWIARRDTLNSKLERARRDEREQIVARLRQIHSTAPLDPEGALDAISRELDRLASKEDA